MKKTALQILDERCKDNPELQKAYEIEKENYMDEIQKINHPKTPQFFLQSQIEYLESLGFTKAKDWYKS